ncbi:hemagglutinin repeat-containing protein, partial [Kiloniella sp. EL199]|uniref:hemagglutinin repeat-containing protein n=1 Tax=Kiloniella sp. EL199 TaxID=2107581 RepID=UPI001576BB7B
GLEVPAGLDVSLEAGDGITLTAAQSTYALDHSSKSKSASVGASVGIGVTGATTSVSGSISGSASNRNVDSLTNINSRILAGNDVTLKSGDDTTLKGAQVQAGGSIDADVGGDLTVASVQDTNRIDGNSKGGSLGLSIGLDGSGDTSSDTPAAGGTAVNGSLSYGNEKGRKAWVEEQSALIAKGNVDVTVGGHTQLDGAVIASTEGDVALDTETFDYSDIQDHDNYKNVNGSISGSIGVGGGDSGDSASPDLLDRIAALPTIEGSYENAEKEQITRATVAAPNGDATITIRANPGQGIEGLNNALEKAQEITKDKKTKVKVYVDGAAIAEVVSGFQGLREAVATAADKVEAVANLIEAQLAVLPEALKVKGEAIDGLYRDLISQGIDPEEAYEIINSPMGEMLQVQAYLEKNGGDTDLSSLSYEERQSLYKILGTSIQLASTSDVLTGIGITLEQVQQDAGLYLLNNYKKGFSWAADTLRENPEAATAIIGMTDMVANSVWSLMAAAEGGLEVVNPSTNGQESPEFSLDYYASEYEAGVKRLIRDKEALGEGTEAIQQGAIDLFLETIKDSDISPEKAALYATVAASSVIVTRVVAKRLTGGSGNTRKEVNELADTLDNLTDQINVVEQTVQNRKIAANYFGQKRQFWTQDPIEFNGNKVYQRNDIIDPNRIDPISGKTNLELMRVGRAPLGPDGKAVNLHHMIQTQHGPITEVTQSFHQQNFGTIHINTGKLPSGVNRAEFNAWRRNYWKNRAIDFEVE